MDLPSHNRLAYSRVHRRSASPPGAAAECFVCAQRSVPAVVHMLSAPPACVLSLCLLFTPLSPCIWASPRLYTVYTAKCTAVYTAKCAGCFLGVDLVEGADAVGARHEHHPRPRPLQHHHHHEVRLKEMTHGQSRQRGRVAFRSFF